MYILCNSPCHWWSLRHHQWNTSKVHRHNATKAPRLTKKKKIYIIWLGWKTKSWPISCSAHLANNTNPEFQKLLSHDFFFNYSKLRRKKTLFTNKKISFPFQQKNICIKKIVDTEYTNHPTYIPKIVNHSIEPWFCWGRRLILFLDSCMADHSKWKGGHWQRLC